MSDKEPNYSAADVAVIMAAVPFNLDGAKEIAAKLGRDPKNGWRSIVAKVKRLENDETVKGERPFYLAKAPYITKTGKDVEKKTDIVATIEAVLNVKAPSLAKAGKADLERVRDALVSLAKGEEYTEGSEVETAE